MKKKKNKELSARIKADSSTQDEAALSVRRHNTKPDVTCSQSRCDFIVTNGDVKAVFTDSGKWSLYKTS